MELALLRLFQRGGRDNNQIPAHLAECVFQEDPLATREALIEHGFFAPGVTVEAFVDLMTNYRETRLRADSQRRRAKIDRLMAKIADRGNMSQHKQDRTRAQEELRVCKQERAMRAAVEYENAWIPAAIPNGDAPASEHTYWLTVLARVGFARLMLTLTPRDGKVGPCAREKTDLWLNAHIPLLKYMDQNGIVHDRDVDPAEFNDGYLGNRAADYPEDHAMFQERTWLVPNPKRPMPDEILAEIDFDMPDILEQAADVYRIVSRNPRCSLVTWLTSMEQQQQQRGDDRPWFTCKKFSNADDVLDHCIWSSVLMSLRALEKICNSGTNVADKYKDAAYLWQLAFLELAEMCAAAGRFDDQFMLAVDSAAGVTPLEAFYPWPGRAFHAGDLPNPFPTLSLIPLQGEEHVPEFDMARLINKSLPFACMRRRLTDTARKAIRSNTAFYKVFAKIIQCMLLGVYPGTKNRLHGDTALEMLRICSNSKTLIQKLSISEDQSCRIIFTAVRSYVCEYGRLNPTYAAASDEIIYWYGMVRDTRAMSDLIRDTNLLAIDTFAEARVRLNRHGKSSGAIVYRYRDKCVSEYMFKVVSKQLEHNTYAEMEDCRRDNDVFERLLSSPAISLAEGVDGPLQKVWKQALGTSHGETLSHVLASARGPQAIQTALRECIAFNQQCIERYREAIPKGIKQDILNMLLLVPEPLRFTEPCFSQLCQPKFGGLRRAVVHSLVRLVDLYHEQGSPKETREQLADFSPYELRITTWFLHCCRLYDRIHLVPLDPATEARIENTMMTKRVSLYPGVQQLHPNDFTVYATVCCEKIITMTDGIYGHDKVRYDSRLKQPVCKPKGKSTKKILAPDHEEIWYPQPAQTSQEVKERAKAHKLNFIRISCPQPVMRINLRGFKLVVGSNRGTKHQYMHCPQCASFHKMDVRGFRAKGGYACQNCLAQDKTLQRNYQCAYCHASFQPRWDEETNRWRDPETIVRVLRVNNDPEDRSFDAMRSMNSIWQDLYFCPTHYTAAVAISHQRIVDRGAGRPSRYLEKEELFRRIGASQMRNAQRAKNIQFASRGIPQQK